MNIQITIAFHSVKSHRGTYTTPNSQAADLLELATSHEDRKRKKPKTR